MRNLCVDTCFLLGLYDVRDQYHEEAKTHFARLFENENNRMLVPWPVIYETFSTRIVRNKSALSQLQRDWSRLAAQRQLELLPDGPYRDEVIDECFNGLNDYGRYRALSSADRVIRKILSDRSLRIHALVTFNVGDFADVCVKFGRQIYPQPRHAR